jgi:hypothetical protein
MSAPRKRVFRVFWRDYVTGEGVSSSAPESLAGEQIAPLAERLLAAPDNYIGVIDANELILQAWCAEVDGPVQLELLYPEDSGMLHLSLPLPEALALLERLPQAFDESLLPGAQFRMSGA